jgi:leucyl aminopeptidase (aminopeptidase T)
VAIRSLSLSALSRLVLQVFRPRDGDRSLAFLFDLPDERLADNADWVWRRAMLADWTRKLREARAEVGLDVVDLFAYRNVRSNNADLPREAWPVDPDRLPEHAADVAAPSLSMEHVLAGHRLIVAATELSATAPLKLAAPRHGFRAATMPGFTADMLSALALDWERVHERCLDLKRRIDRAAGAELSFLVGDEPARLDVDLRHRVSVASGGLVTEPGTAGNVPSGETYIVPYEGEREHDESRTRGVLPLELEGELLLYHVERNRVASVLGEGPVARREREALAAEPAYANVAELGFGVLADFGVRPVGRILLDEKLGLHVAFGRSDHFGGRVGAKDFSSPEAVVHVDRVYLPELQPRVRVAAVDLVGPAGEREPLMRDGSYVK